MALTFEVGNQWLGRTQFTAEIFTGTSGTLYQFLSFWAEGKEPACVMFDSYIKIFIMTLGLPALTLCCALGSSSVEVRDIPGGKCF